jgi:hypothetical protein
VTKHALSLGRSELHFLFICVGLKAVLAIFRHRFETIVSVQDCHPAMFFVDLVKDYADVLSFNFQKKAYTKSLYRTLALLKRTAPIDMNMSRTRLSAGNEVNNWVASQRMQGKFPSPIPTPVAPVQPTPPVPDPVLNSTPPVAQRLHVCPRPPLPVVKPTPTPKSSKLTASALLATPPAVADVRLGDRFQSPAFTSLRCRSLTRITDAALVKVSPPTPTPKRRNSGPP